MNHPITPEEVVAARAAHPLSPCPFCAGNGFAHANEIQAHFNPLLSCTEGAYHWVVRCFGCGAQQSPQETAAKAVHHWNGRT